MFNILDTALRKPFLCLVYTVARLSGYPIEVELQYDNTFLGNGFPGKF